MSYAGVHSVCALGLDDRHAVHRPTYLHSEPYGLSWMVYGRFRTAIGSGEGRENQFEKIGPKPRLS